MLNNKAKYFITLLLLGSFLSFGCGNNKADKYEQHLTKHIDYMKSVGIAVPERSKIRREETYEKDTTKATFDRISLTQGPVDLIFKTSTGELLKLIVYHGLTIEDQAKGDPICVYINGTENGKYPELLKNHEKYDCKQIKTSKNNQSKNESSSKSSSSATSSTSTVTDDKFMTDFNTVMSNQYKGLYVGSRLTIGSVTSGTIRIYVSPLWYSLNEGQKNAFVMQTTKWYFGMLGARGMSYNMDKIDLFFRDPNTEAQVAKWGSIRGVVINK